MTCEGEKIGDNLKDFFFFAVIITTVDKFVKKTSIDIGKIKQKLKLFGF